MHISGVLVKARPERLDDIEQALGAMQGVEVHGSNEDGRMVVIVEQEDAGQVCDTLLHMQQVPGVLAANMIYHHFDA